MRCSEILYFDLHQKSNSPERKKFTETPAGKQSKQGKQILRCTDFLLLKSHDSPSIKIPSGEGSSAFPFIASPTADNEELEVMAWFVCFIDNFPNQLM